MRESTLQGRILQWLHQQPRVWAFKAAASGYTGRGVPDIVACVDGHFIAFEVKTATGKPTVLQEHAIRDINRAGGTAYVVRSLPQVQELVREVMEKAPA